jgi:hypothetical protein
VLTLLLHLLPLLELASLSVLHLHPWLNHCHLLLLLLLV